MALGFLKGFWTYYCASADEGFTNGSAVVCNLANIRCRGLHYSSFSRGQMFIACSSWNSSLHAYGRRSATSAGSPGTR